MTKPGTKNIAKFYNTMYSSINYSHGAEYAGLFDIAIFIPIPFFFFFFYLSIFHGAAASAYNLLPMSGRHIHIYLPSPCIQA